MKKKLRFSDVARTISGFSIPLFGLSWNPPEDERKIIYNLFVFLEDRRVLFYPQYLETTDWVNRSILEIREELTSTLQKLPNNSKAVPHLKMMRAACRKYLDDFEKIDSNIMFYEPFSSHRFPSNLFLLIGELRGVFGSQITLLSPMYGVDIEDELITLIPPEDENVSD